MKLCKKGIFYFLLIVGLALFQITASHQHRIMTFHDKTERKWIRLIENRYDILDGTWDSQVGSSSQAIFGYRIAGQKKQYVALARKKNSVEDVLLFMPVGANTFQESFPFSPYSLQINNNLDFRGVMDLDMDHHQDLVVVVNGNYGKRFFVFPLLEKIAPEPFLMLETYHRIQFLDLDQDGLTEIIASTEKDGILQPPSIFHYQAGRLYLQNNAEYPMYMSQYYVGLQTKKQLYRLISQPALQNELLLTEMRYHIGMENTNQAISLYYTMVSRLPKTGIERKLPIYRGKTLLAYAFLKKNQLAMADTILQEAVREFLPEDTPENFVLSQFYAEKGLGYLQDADFKKVQQFTQQALALNPDNMSARQLQDWLPDLSR